MVSSLLAVACYVTVHKISREMTEDDGEWFTDPEHHWQASDLVKYVVSTAAP